MSICTVNGSAYEAKAGLETWGQLLAALEQGDGPARPVVAAVRFAGVGDPTFREPETLSLNLRESAPIEVELSTAGELVASARQAVLSGLDVLAASARQAADAFRLHDLPRAHRGLADFVTTFHLLATVTGAVGLADVSAGHLGADARSADFLECVRLSLESLVACELNEDWISAADVLEYEIADLLPQWATVVSEVGDDRVIHAIAGSTGNPS